MPASSPSAPCWSRSRNPVVLFLFQVLPAGPLYHPGQRRSRSCCVNSLAACKRSSTSCMIFKLLIIRQNSIHERVRVKRLQVFRGFTQSCEQNGKPQFSLDRKCHAATGG